MYDDDDLAPLIRDYFESGAAKEDMMSTQKTVFEINGVVWEGHIQKAMADIEYARRTYHPDSQEYQDIIRFALESLSSDVASRSVKEDTMYQIECEDAIIHTVESPVCNDEECPCHED